MVLGVERRGFVLWRRTGMHTERAVMSREAMRFKQHRPAKAQMMLRVRSSMVIWDESSFIVSIGVEASRLAVLSRSHRKGEVSRNQGSGRKRTKKINEVTNESYLFSRLLRHEVKLHIQQSFLPPTAMFDVTPNSTCSVSELG